MKTIKISLTIINVYETLINFSFNEKLKNIF